jgi:cytochrome c553
VARPCPAAELSRAETIVAGKCFICHGLRGESSSKLYPKLAGQHARYIAKQLADFQSGRRKSDTMMAMAADISPDEMLALGRYFEQQPSQPTPVSDSGKADAGRLLYYRGNPDNGLPPCADCHGQRGMGTPLLPRLAGQRRNYLETQLANFNSRQRNNDNEIMHRVAEKLSAEEVTAVAEFISAFD